MTVTAANETARTGYTATGGETTFDYTFEIAASGDLAVERNGVVLPTSHYSVAGAGTEDGGTITKYLAGGKKRGNIEGGPERPTLFG